jgi:hypothetical protein
MCDAGAITDVLVRPRMRRSMGFDETDLRTIIAAFALLVIKNMTPARPLQTDPVRRQLFQIYLTNGRRGLRYTNRRRGRDGRVYLPSQLYS